MPTAAMTGCLILGLAGCGSGSDYSSACGYDVYGNPLPCSPSAAPAPPAPVVASTSGFAVQQALVNVATLPESFSISSFDAAGNTYALTSTTQPGGPALFNGIPAATATVTQTLYGNGVLLSSSQYVDYYDPGTYELVGSSGSSAGSFAVVTSGQAPPQTAFVGQGFPAFSANLYRDSSQVVVDGSVVENLSVSADTVATALLCMNDTVQLTQAGIADGLNGAPSSTCYRIDPAGNVLGLVATLFVNGISLTFQ